MAHENKQQNPTKPAPVPVGPDRVEALAAQLYAAMYPTRQQRGLSSAGLAAECLAAANEFIKLCDEGKQ